MSNYRHTSFLKKIEVILLGFIFYLLPASSNAQDNSEKEIAKYNDWSVFVNYSEITNIRCQVKTMAVADVKDYFGAVSIWKENNLPSAEVGLYKVSSTLKPSGVILKKDLGAQLLIIKSMRVKGFRRDTDPFMALFNVGHGMIEAMLETDSAIATLIDSDGKEYNLLIDLKGLKQAWNHCYPQK